MKGILKSIKRGAIRGISAAVTVVSFCMAVSILGDLLHI